MSIRLSLALAGCSLCAPMFGQFGPSTAIHGAAVGSSDYRQFSAELYDQTRHQVVQSQPLGSSGEFNFFAETGTYLVRIVDARGDVLGIAPAGGGPNSQPVSIDLPHHSKSAPVQGTISAADLARAHNKRLQKEFIAAERAAREGHLRASITHLLRVVSIDPSYAGAWVNLGVRYVRLGQFMAGRDALLKAIEADSKLSIAYSNLAVADLASGDPIGAVEVSRAALRLNPADPVANRIVAALTAKR